MAFRLVIYLLLLVGVTCHHCSRQPSPGNDDTAGNTKWPQENLCMAVPDLPTFRGREYVTSVQLLNDIGDDIVDHGHPGLVFNLIDSSNYDFLFLRPHWPHACYGYGYVANGNMVYDGSKTGRCLHGAPKRRTWHDLKLHVVGRETRVYLNNLLLATIPHHFPNVARSGPAILNGFKNRAYFRGFTIKPTC